MVPAMDRVKSRLAPSPRWILGLSSLLWLSLSGCAEIKSQIFGDSRIGELGRVEESNDIYAQNHQPRVLMPSPNSVSQPGEPMPPGAILTEVKEAGPALLPAQVDTNNPSSAVGVSLLGPRPVDPNSGVQLASTRSGVPDASRILAAAERKPEIKPETLVVQARTALEAMTCYEVSLHRQERVNGSLLPEEDVVLAIRRTPLAVRLSWPDGPNKGREALYRSDEPGGQMHIKMANPALPRLSLNPESPMVMRNSRHPLTEAGFDSLIEGLENGVNANALTYTGIETPKGLDHPAHCLTRTTPSGENWRVYLDVENHLPSLVQAVDARGELLERYLFHDIKANPTELTATDAFDPIARWGQPRGLFSRMTRSSNEFEAAAPADSTPQ